METVIMGHEMRSASEAVAIELMVPQARGDREARRGWRRGRPESLPDQSVFVIAKGHGAVS